MELIAINFSVPLCNNPISVIMYWIISPCNILIHLGTPCVGGCCGPILVSIIIVLIEEVLIVDVIGFREGIIIEN